MESSTAQLIKVLKASITALAFTQKEVERRLELSPGYLSRLFGGQIDLKADHVVQIARVLQVEPEEIYRLAFPSSRREPTPNGRRLREAFEITAPEPKPEVLSQIEADIERIVQRVLDRRGTV